MPIILTLLATALATASGNFSFGILCGLTVGLVLLRNDYNSKMSRLQQDMDLLRERVNEGHSETGAATSSEGIRVSNKEAATDLEHSAIDADEARKKTELETLAQPTESAETPQPPSAIDKLFNKARDLVWSYFTDGNVFVRIGLLILFFGVAFLLRYAAENSMIPVQLRYIAAAVVGLALLGFGWRLKTSNRVYALLLQGGGIGVIYITIFAAYARAELLPSALAFTLLVLFAVFTALLAVVQNARGLAIFAILGGFLAPFLASSGSGNYIGLFSYYALLNSSVFFIAWYKSWRLLNLLGFAFTFLVFGVWYLFEYEPAMRNSASAFLFLFFLMYSMLGVLYALKQEHRLRGLVDGTLVFGTPIITSSLLMGMFREFDYGIAMVAAGLGIYYVLISRFLWKRSGEQMQLMAEAMLAIGVVFATLAIPYSLSGHWTSASWALEAAGILWVSLRQHKAYAQWFAIAVQFAAGGFFLLTNANDTGSSAWLNPAFMGSLFIALGSLVSAKLLHNTRRQTALNRFSPVFFVWGIAWWLYAVGSQVDVYFYNYPIEVYLLLLSATAAAAIVLDAKKQWHWKSVRVLGALLLPALALVAWGSTLAQPALLTKSSSLAWLLALAACYWIIGRLEAQGWNRKLLIAWHTGFALLVAMIMGHDLLAYLHARLPLIGSAYAAIVVVPLLLLAYLARQNKLAATKRLGEPLAGAIVLATLLLLSAWSLLFNLNSTGTTYPLPYFPLLNALDLTNLAVFFTAAASIPLLQKAHGVKPSTVFIIIGALAFVWLSAVLLRALHHYINLPFEWAAMSNSATVQTALTILWTSIGMAAMLFASKQQLRPLWLAAAGLIGIVLVKMFFIDLDASGTVERIVSFMVVGLMLVALGYFSPLPVKRAEARLEQQ